MKALTLIQPWAWAICYAGKRVENRTWPLPNYMIGDRIAIHAGAKMDRDDKDYIECIFDCEIPAQEIAHRAIVATATLSGCVAKSDDQWFNGPYGFVLSNVYVLSKPVPCKGALGFWRVPDEVERQFGKSVPADEVFERFKKALADSQ